MPSDAAAPERLADLIPPPPDPKAVDWARQEARLGTSLPADFRAFVERWGSGGVFDSAFTISLTDHGEWLGDALRDFMNDGDVERRPVWPEAGGLLGWGSTESTKWYLLWDTAKGSPDAWTVVVLDEDNQLTDTGLAFLDYLVGALAGEIAAALIPAELEPLTPEEAAEAGDEPLGSRGHFWARY